MFCKNNGISNNIKIEYIEAQRYNAKDPRQAVLLIDKYYSVICLTKNFINLWCLDENTLYAPVL
jgi:hypothetical protein